jgi:hypothetical protein
MSATFESESPPKNEIGPAVGTVEPKAMRSARGRAEVDDSAAAAIEVKPTVGDDFDPEAARAKLVREVEQLQVIDDVDDAGAQLTPMSKKDAFRKVARLLKKAANDDWSLKITDLVIRGKSLDVMILDTATELHRVATVEDRRDVGNPRRLREAFAAGCNRALWFGGEKDLRELADLLLRFARIDYEFPEQEETWGWVLQNADFTNDVLHGERNHRALLYSGATHIYRTNSGLKVAGWREGDEAVVNIQTLLAFVHNHNLAPRAMTRSDLGTRLSRCGFWKPSQREFTNEGARVRFYPWVTDMCNVEMQANVQTEVVESIEGPNRYRGEIG